MEEVKKKKEVIKKTGGDDQPDWQDVSVNLEWTTHSINLVKSPHDENRIARQILKLICYFLILQNLSSWKDRRRKQSEEALQRVAEVKGVKIESEDDDFNRQKKM